MEANEKWNRIVLTHRANYNKPEKDIQKLWEAIFCEIFEYSKLSDEIVPQMPMHIGTGTKLADIAIKANTTDSFLVELKQHNASLGANYEEQLISYLKQTHYSVGVLVCNKLYVYFHNHGDNKTIKTEIEFTNDNKDGIEFVELFSKNNFDKSAVENFIAQKNNSVKNINKIKQELTPKLLEELARLYFSENYSEKEIDSVLTDLDIVIKPKSQPRFTSPYPVQHSTYQTDKTPPGGNKYKVFGILNSLKDKGLLKQLLPDLESRDFSSPEFKLSYPTLIPATDFPHSGYDKVRFYKDEFDYDGIRYLVCSQWIPDRIKRLEKWYNDILNNPSDKY